MQNKKTDSYQLPELPDITDKQKRFAEYIAQGMTASDAYRAAYDCEKTTNSVIWSESSRLKSDPKVTTWIEALRDAMGYSPICSLEGHQKRLEELSRKAELSGNYGAAVQAEQLRGKVAGHYTEKIEHVHTDNGLGALFDLLNNETDQGKVTH